VRKVIGYIKRHPRATSARRRAFALALFADELGPRSAEMSFSRFPQDGSVFIIEA
jgi:hypothetical protein